MYYYVDFSKYEIVKSETKLDTSIDGSSSLLSCRDEQYAKALLYDTIKSDLMTKVEFFAEKLAKLKG